MFLNKRMQFTSSPKYSRLLILFVFSAILFSCKTRQITTQKSIEKTFKKKHSRQFRQKWNKNTNHIVKNEEAKVFGLGADNFDGYSELLKNQNVGIVTNQTGILSDQTHLVDFLISKEVAVKKIYAPEHGFRGMADAGELILDGKDVKTGLPIISLYGDNKKPKPEQLAGISIMIFDLQDVGVRFYTYISTLHCVMEACAENNIPLIILDRPNPNGSIVDGPILDMQYTSFVGMHPIPVLHGMTIGEYAQMINGEKWLKDGIQCPIQIISCSAYKREMPYSLPVKPSPNLPNDQSINLYASLCLFEGTNVSLGRGTDKQFQIYGSPFLPNIDFCFIPKPNLGAKDPLYNNRDCFGEDLTNIPKVNQLELKWLIKAYEETSDKSKFFTSFFTKLAGSKQLQQQIQAGMCEEEIRKSWEPGLAAFKEMRKKYLIY
ncbi:MAG: exo-beta-N-acetylmuramidase NamZ domain-containing protein [Flavobacterium sp.]